MDARLGLHLDARLLKLLRVRRDRARLNAVRRHDGSLQLNDLRFGTFSGSAKDADDYIFRFKLIDRGPQEAYGFERAQGGPPDEKAEDMMMELFDRASGRAIETPMR